MKLIRRKEFENLIISISAAVMLWGALALAFDFFYDLNDDVLIKDILAGIYTGMPDAHNNQMLYPVSVILAGLYRLSDRIPWFGLFEIACMTGSFILIAVRISELISRRCKILYVLFQTVLFAGLMMWELVNVQYTVVAGVLTAAAAVWLYCGPPVKKSMTEGCKGIDAGVTEAGVSGKATPTEMCAFIRRNIPAILLVILAFNIRSELALLLSPLLAATAIAKWSEEVYKKDAFVLCGYLGVFLGICILMLVSLGADRIAYGSPEWKEYRRFFDARTDLYDFTGLPDYEENIDFYKAEGITEDQYELLAEYDYYMDESIDVDMLERIAQGVKNGRAKGRSTYGKSIKESMWEYVHNVLDVDICAGISDINRGPDGDVMSTDHIFADEANQHKPFNIVIIVLYLGLIISAFFTQDMTCIIKVPVLIVLRTIPWVYIYLQGRVLSRITHPLYMLEVLLLIMMLISCAGKDKDIDHTKRSRAYVVSAVTAIVISAVCMTAIVKNAIYLQRSGTERQAVNDDRVELYEYTSSDMNMYFYIDTYSTVDWTEKIFGEDIVSKKNTQLLGGWMGNSPLDKKKREGYSQYKVLLTK